MNTRQDKFDPYNHPYLTYSKNKEINRIIRDTTNFEPVLQELYFHEMDDSKVFIVKDLKTEHIIAGKIFTQFYSKVQNFSKFEVAKLFLTDVENNLFYSQFFYETITLFKKNKHPFQQTFVPPLFINDITKKIYKGVNYFNILYKNIQSKNDERVFISNHIIIRNNFQYKNKESLITIVDSYDTNENKPNFDMICARNNLVCLADKKYNFKSNLKIKQLPIKDDDENYLKMYKTINNFFYCTAYQKTYEPNEFITSESFFFYIKENPTLFIEAVKLLGTENLSDINTEEYFND